MDPAQQTEPARPANSLTGVSAEEIIANVESDEWGDSARRIGISTAQLFNQKADR
ncbi:hypothetical protein [Streptomyces sp. NPDC005953]|uniref:hypothetical protein n=1 Tax=Streptomyces sp. NPDC005953 TaxID=3156719 RepID=UPI0034084A3D